MKQIRVAVLVPRYSVDFSQEEEITLQHLNHFLFNYHKCWLSPKHLLISSSPFGVLRLDGHFFANTSSYSQLLLSHEFYAAFQDYEYILIYQLDCLVFSDQLEQWCAAGYDYIGAPLFHDKTNPNKGFSRVGNGGFSLRRVESFLKVLASQRYTEEYVPLWKDFLTTRLPDADQYPATRRWLKKLRVLREVRRGVAWYTQHYSLNEDLFWSDRAHFFYPQFKVAPIREGLRFAFEKHPRYCFEQNGRQLPFGCHAWAKWDRAFWEPYLKLP